MGRGFFVSIAGLMIGQPVVLLTGHCRHVGQAKEGDNGGDEEGVSHDRSSKCVDSLGELAAASSGWDCALL